MNTEIKELNIKAKRKLYYLEKTYGLQNLFNIKTEFKNEKEEREYLNKLKEFLFSSKFKYVKGGKYTSYREKDYGKEYYYPIKRSEWQQIKTLIKKRNKQCNKQINKKYFSKFRINKKSIIFNYQIKRLIKSIIKLQKKRVKAK